MKYLSISILLALPASILATEGGRCAYGWGPECICLDANVCTDSYGGFANAGWEGNWPCPSDASNVVGCTINPCPGYEDDWNSNTDCRWSESCGGVVLEDPVCPGGNGFVCCGTGLSEILPWKRDVQAVG